MSKIARVANEFRRRALDLLGLKGSGPNPPKNNVLIQMLCDRKNDKLAMGICGRQSSICHCLSRWIPG